MAIVKFLTATGETDVSGDQFQTLGIGVGTTPPTTGVYVGAGGKLRIDAATGDLTRIKNVPYSFPASQGAAGSVMTNDGTGNLSWQTIVVPSGQTRDYTCPSGLAVGDWVYSDGADTVNKANATSAATMPAVGVVVAKPASTTATVQHRDEVSGFVGLTVGATYFVSTTAGTVSTTAPAAAGNIIQPVGGALNTTTLMVIVDRYLVERS